MLAVEESGRYTSPPDRKVAACGAVAQLGERLGRIEEVVGSIPIGSIDPARPLPPTREGGVRFRASIGAPTHTRYRGPAEPKERSGTSLAAIELVFAKIPPISPDPRMSVRGDWSGESARPLELVGSGTSDERSPGPETLEFESNSFTPLGPHGSRGVFIRRSRRGDESFPGWVYSMKSCEPTTPSDNGCFEPSPRCSSAC